MQQLIRPFGSSTSAYNGSQLLNGHILGKNSVTIIIVIAFIITLAMAYLYAGLIMTIMNFPIPKIPVHPVSN
ncbi:MAG TPA: hypothetical protein VGN20_17885 [Mucilaginibacter sp.]|jgi:hypothetical protein